MCLQLMCFEIHLALEHHKLLRQTLLVWTCKVVLPKVHFQRIIVQVVLVLLPVITTITYVAALVLLTTMRKQLVIAVEALSAEAAFGMALETALIDCAWSVIAEFFMLAEFSGGEEFVFMRKHLLVTGTEVTTRQA